MTPPSPEAQAAALEISGTNMPISERALAIDRHMASRVRAAVERVIELCVNCEAISDAKMTKSEIIAMTIRREFADILRYAPEPRNE